MMTKAERERIERRLLAERRSALEDLADLDERAREALRNDDGDLTRHPFHPADQAGDTEAGELGFAVAEHERRRIVAIDDAIERLREAPEQFGRCGECGREIPLERLELVPWTPYCAACETAVEARARGRVRSAAIGARPT
ncbi:MAG: TraR/DksA family transcriptional regulator [Gemmatimonadota bacterium]